MEKKLYRDETRKKLGGVCVGLADYFNIDVAIIRLVFVLSVILHGTGVLAYIVLWIVLPKRDYRFNNPTVDYTVPPQTPGNDPFQPNTFQNNPYQGAPFAGTPFPNQPFPKQHSSTSLVGIIFGVILIVVGGSILLDEFDILPDWDFSNLWPLALVAIGGALIFSGEKKKPWEKSDWHKPDPEEKVAAAEDTNTEGGSTTDTTTPPADNQPTV